MPKNYLYAYNVEKGVKIGTSAKPIQRKKQHSSAGNEIEFFATIVINKIEIDQELKSGLIKLGKQMNLKNSSSKEVFDITEEETKVIFGYIKIYQTINADTLRRILEADNVCEQKIMTLKELKDNYTNKTFVNFRYQRIPDTDHVNDILKYITENYMKLAFVLPPVVVIKYGASFEVIDGMHRCMAIEQIHNEHPCLKYKINVCQYTRELADPDRINIFRTINKSKPVHEIYLGPNELKSIITKTDIQLKKDFGKSITEKNTMNIYIEHKYLEELYTMENINLLIQKNKIKGISDKEIYKLLTEVNDFLYENIKSVDKDIFDIEYDYNEITSDAWEEIHEFLNRINKTNIKLNIPKYEKIFTQICEERQQRIKGTKELKVKREYKETPFLFNLIDFSKTNLLNIILMD